MHQRASASLHIRTYGLAQLSFIYENLMRYLFRLHLCLRLRLPSIPSVCTFVCLNHAPWHPNDVYANSWGIFWVRVRLCVIMCLVCTYACMSTIKFLLDLNVSVSSLYTSMFLFPIYNKKQFSIWVNNYPPSKFLHIAPFSLLSRFHYISHRNHSSLGRTWEIGKYKNPFTLNISQR